MSDSADHPPSSLGELLAARRREQFVGRAGEVELFGSALAADDPPFRVLFVHGPGGIGKTASLDAFADAARAAGAAVIRVDGRDIGGPTDLRCALAQAVGTAPRTGSTPGAADDRRKVLLIDTFEQMTSFEASLRDHLLPELPASTLTVLTGRQPPSTRWRTDGAWSGLLRVLSLRNLDPDSARRYLGRRGVAADRHAEALAVTHGHPLALSLLADVLTDRVADDIGPAQMPLDVVGELLGRLVSGVPSAVHQRALGVLAIARTTTEGLLTEVLGEAADARALFDWLAGLSVTELRVDGVRPHDLVRELLDADLRWRDPDAYRTVARAVSAHAVARAGQARGREQQRAVADVKFLFRNLRGVRSPVSWRAWGDHYPDRAAAADRPAAIDIVRRAEGAVSAGLADRWFDRQPQSFHVIRDGDGSVRGVVALLDLTAADAADRDADPGTAAAWRYAAAQALRDQLADGRPLRPLRFQRQVARIVGVAWMLATGADLAFPQVEGRRTAGTRFVGRYVDRLQAGAARDPSLGRAFLRVTCLVDPPSALWRPATLARALRS